MSLVRCLTPPLAILILCLALPIARAQPGEVREFAVTAKKYAFEPSTFEVTEGDRVRLLVTATDTDHGIEIKKLDVDELTVEDETTTVEFVASKPGTFTIICAEYCGKGHKTMKATLVVRPRTSAANAASVPQSR